MRLFWTSIICSVACEAITKKQSRNNKNVMAASESIIGGRSNVADLLEPFYQRASEAEDRLSKLESAFASKKDATNEELLKIINELQENLDGANADLASAREKVAKLALENAKMQYRIHHLVQAFRQQNAQLWSM